MSFVRPDLAARLTAWREPLFWAGATALGLWLAAGGWRRGDLLALGLGGLVALAAAGLLVAALRGLRFRRAAPAEGVVAVDEARIGYLGPRGGGYLDLDDLVRVEIAGARGRAAWRLTDERGTVLVIPLGARGAAAIPDALARLPGLDLAPADAALAGRAPRDVAVWTRPGHATLGRLP